MKRIIIILITMVLIILSTSTFVWAQGEREDTNRSCANGNSIYVNQLNCKGTMSKSQILSTAGKLKEGVDSSKVDIVFVIDSTGSMDDEIGSIVSNINDFARIISEAGFDYRIAIVDYKDITEGEATQIVSYGGRKWLNNVSEVQGALNSIYVNGGGDDDETPIDAFGNMLETLSFRSDAGKLAVLFTDAGYKTDNNYGYSSLSDLADTLKSKSIMTSVVSDPWYSDDYEALYETTGGMFIDIYDEFSSELIQLAEYYKLYVSPIIDVDSGFRIKRDNNSFSHSKKKGGGFWKKDTDVTYVLDDAYYNKLVSNATEAEKDSIKKHMHKTWEGSCYGIAATMGLVANRYLKIGDISNYSEASYYKMAPPNKNSKLLNSINYYQLSHYLNSYNAKSIASEICYPKSFFESLFNWDSTNEGLTVCLMKMVEAAKKGDVLQLCYSYKKEWFGKTAGHAILITGVRYEDDNKQYVVKLYDENGDSFTEMYIDKYFKSFYFTDAKGNDINEDNFCSMYFFDYSKLKAISGLSKTKSTKMKTTSYDTSDDETVMIFDASDSFYLNSDEGSLGFDGDELWGSLPVNDLSFVIENNKSRIKIVTKHCDNITVSDIDRHINIDMFDDNDYKSIEGDNIRSLFMEQDGDIELEGDDFDFNAFSSSNFKAVKNENALAGVSGHAQDDVTIYKSGNDVYARSNEAMENMETVVMLGSKKYEEKPGDDEEVNIKTSSASNLNKFGKINISKTGYVYSGKTITPNVKVVCGSQLLDKKADYIISYSNNKNVGTATIKIAGKGSYDGIILKTFKINPKGTAIKKPTGVKKGFVAKWSKQASKMNKTRITGYQVRYSPKKNFSDGVKRKTIKGYKKTSIKVKKLKANKTYYVQVRTYKTLNGNKYYSPWSKTEVVKTK